MAGFIHGALDIKLLILYLLSRIDSPIDFSTLTDLALCDPGVDYFLFAQCAAELVQSGHIQVEDGLYSITEKGRNNSAESADSLSPVVRRRCAEPLSRLNAELRRRAQVRAQVVPRDEGGFVLRLDLDDDGGNLFALELFTPTEESARRMARRFRSDPQAVYQQILAAVLGPEEGA